MKYNNEFLIRMILRNSQWMADIPSLAVDCRAALNASDFQVTFENI